MENARLLTAAQSLALMDNVEAVYHHGIGALESWMDDGTVDDGRWTEVLVWCN